MTYETMRSPPRPVLRALAETVACGDPDPVIAVEAPWTEIAGLAADLMARRFSGEAALIVSAG